MAWPQKSRELLPETYLGGKRGYGTRAGDCLVVKSFCTTQFPNHEYLLKTTVTKKIM